MTEMQPQTATPHESNFRPGAGVILCADDFAISDGVSRGIEELALARRLSATSAIVTLPEWERHGKALAGLRGYLAIGLHVNLTLGAPLGPMPHLAPDGELPGLGTLVGRTLNRAACIRDIAAEIERQLDRFVVATGYVPDFIDGHQHVHAMPRIRRALLEVASARFPATKPLIRDPADSAGTILRRSVAAPKALAIALFAWRFGNRVRAAGFPTNHGFAGVSQFNIDTSFEDELICFFSAPGRRHLVMCHPGYADATLAELDSVVVRRRQELDAIFAAPHLDEAIWHVSRRADGPQVDWQPGLPA